MKRLSRILILLMIFTMFASSFVFADDEQKFLSLGKDLTAEQTSTVLGFFGNVDINECKVVYITNADEHKYLDSYVDKNQIGTKALSSVLIEENDENDIDVEIHNINYCTEGMYKNALSTAGVTGAHVIVAGPFQISGTAALVGTIKAYEEMTGQEVSDDVIEGCVDELTTTGDIGEEVGDKSAIEEIIADIKSQVADNPDMSDADIIAALKAAAEKAGVTLSDDQIERLKDLITKLKGLDVDWDNVKEQSLDILNKIKSSGLLDDIINWIKSLFN